MTTTTNYGMQLPSGTDPASITPINQNTNFLDTKLKELEDVTDSVIDEIDKNTSSTSGSIVTLTDEAPLTPLKSCVCDIEPIQASGTPSPDNPLAISGWSGVNVVANGKNLIKPFNINGTQYGVTYSTDENGVISFSGTSESAFSLTGTPTLLKAVECVLSGCVDGSATKYELDLTNTGMTTIRQRDTEVTFTLNDTREITPSIIIRSGVDMTGVKFYPMIRLSSVSDNTYEPYNGSTATITWTDANTVYGGSIDLTSGELTVTHKSVDLGDLSWTYQSANTRFLASVSGMAQPSTADERITEIISSVFVANQAPITGDNVDNTMARCQSNIYIKCLAYTDADAFKTAMTGQTLVYPLTTPLTYQLTPTTIKTLSSSPTNLWSDTGDTSITYVVNDKYSNSGIPTVSAVKQYVMEMLGI